MLSSQGSWSETFCWCSRKLNNTNFTERDKGDHSSDKRSPEDPCVFQEEFSKAYVLDAQVDCQNCDGELHGDDGVDLFDETLSGGLHQWAGLLVHQE